MSHDWLLVNGQRVDRRRDRDMVVSASVSLVMLGLVVLGWGPLLGSSGMDVDVITAGSPTGG